MIPPKLQNELISLLTKVNIKRFDSINSYDTIFKLTMEISIAWTDRRNQIYN